LKYRLALIPADLLPVKRALGSAFDVILALEARTHLW